MFEDLFVEIMLRLRQVPMADPLSAQLLRMGGPDRMADRRDIARAVVEHGMADIDVIEEHVRGA